MSTDKDIIIEGLNFSDDLNAFDLNGKLNENLYDDLYAVFKRVSGGGAGVMGFGQTRDIAELGRTLSSVRSAGMQLTNQKFAAKKNIVELKIKQATMDRGSDMEENRDLARAIVRELRENEQSHGSRPAPPPRLTDKAMLHQRIESEMAGGTIKLTSNESAMKYDYKGVVEYAYDDRQKVIVAVEKGTLTPIKGYPAERIPKMKIIKAEKGQAITNTGMNLPIISSKATK